MPAEGSVLEFKDAKTLHDKPVSIYIDFETSHASLSQVFSYYQPLFSPIFHSSVWTVWLSTRDHLVQDDQISSRSAEKDNTFSYLEGRDVKGVFLDFANLLNMQVVKECALNPTVDRCIRTNLEKWSPFPSVPPVSKTSQRTQLWALSAYTQKQLPRPL